MKNNKETPNVPTLRLAGFNDNWRQKKLFSISSYRKIHRKSTKRFYISTENILQNYQGIERFSTNELVSGDGFNCNDILMGNIRPYLKKVCLANFDGVCNADVLVFKSNSVNPHFLYCILANDNFINYVMSSVKGSKMPRGDKGHIMQYSLSVPSDEEQVKISDFFTLLNKRIEIQNKIIEEYISLKKLIIDKIFDENCFIELKLSDLIEKKYIRIIKPSELEQFEGTRIYLSTSSINEFGIIDNEGNISFNQRPSRASMNPIKNSVWFAKMKNSVKVYKAGENDSNKFVLSTGFYGCLCDESKVNSDWLKEIFLSEYFNLQKNKFSEGGTMSGIKDNQLADIEIKLFHDKNLESFHVNKLKSISSKIEVEKKMLEKYKEQKKFLLTNMFI